MDSIPLSDVWDISLSTHMSRKIPLLESAAIPDLLLEMDGPGENIPLWIIEVAFSQLERNLMKKVRRYATECKDAQVITIIDVCESQPYRRPKDTSELAIAMEGRDVLKRTEWKVASDNPAFGPVMSSVPHPWVNPLTIKVKTWLRHPDGEFSLDEPNDSSYYACAVSPYYSSFNKH
jgi:hypothetical protein